MHEPEHDEEDEPEDGESLQGQGQHRHPRDAAARAGAGGGGAGAERSEGGWVARWPVGARAGGVGGWGGRASSRAACCSSGGLRANQPPSPAGRRSRSDEPPARPACSPPPPPFCQAQARPTAGRLAPERRGGQSRGWRRRRRQGGGRLNPLPRLACPGRRARPGLSPRRRLRDLAGVSRERGRGPRAGGLRPAACRRPRRGAGASAAGPQTLLVALKAAPCPAKALSPQLRGPRPPIHRRRARGGRLLPS